MAQPLVKIRDLDAHAVPNQFRQGMGVTEYGDTAALGSSASPIPTASSGHGRLYLSPSWNLHLGYRSLNFNISGSEGSVASTSHMIGPIIAGTFRF
jgi:hypothetical protein